MRRKKEDDKRNCSAKLFEFAKCHFLNRKVAGADYIVGQLSNDEVLKDERVRRLILDGDCTGLVGIRCLAVCSS